MSQRSSSQGSLFAAVVDGMASQEQGARLQKLEIGLGLLGFFTVVSMISTVAATLGGRPALTEALILAGFVALTWPVLRRWQELGRSIAQDAERRRTQWSGTRP
jgi:hypothetical protein